MSSGCDAWRAMLYGPFRESQAAQSSYATERVIPLPDDDASSLAILLNIVHLRFKEVPSSLDFKQLVQLTRLTDKYGATQLLQPWAKSWIAQHKAVIVTPGYEDWLWVAWELGQLQLFEKLVGELVMSVRVRDGKCPTRGSKALDPISPDNHLPPDVIENILTTREKTLTQIVDAVDGVVDTYRISTLALRDDAFVNPSAMH
ncbi:uncharacterized protein IWZ02DRAFT_286658 [Phyllosticta citriasiana]|uniref:uncharacterized protein n=1 Tax=Phyllosticta citriasiana TaxID=595635 RepID=UPI0030FDCF43